MPSCKFYTLRDKRCGNFNFYLQSINGAHKDWVCGLAMLHDSLLVSGCRGGILKLWNAHTCHNLGEIKAHNSPINAVATNSTCIFSASKYVFFVDKFILVKFIANCVINHFLKKVLNIISHFYCMSQQLYYWLSLKLLVCDLKVEIKRHFVGPEKLIQYFLLQLCSITNCVVLACLSSLIYSCGEVRIWKAPGHSAMTMSTGHLFALSL